MRFCFFFFHKWDTWVKVKEGRLAFRGVTIGTYQDLSSTCTRCEKRIFKSTHKLNENVDQFLPYVIEKIEEKY